MQSGTISISLALTTTIIRTTIIRALARMAAFRRQAAAARSTPSPGWLAIVRRSASRLMAAFCGRKSPAGLASGDGAGQRRAKRNPNTYGSFQWPLLCASPAPPQLIPSQRSDYVGTGSNGAQIKNLIYFSEDGRASEIIRPRAGDRSGDLL